jgi:hypothetical protein
LYDVNVCSLYPDIRRKSSDYGPTQNYRFQCRKSDNLNVQPSTSQNDSKVNFISFAEIKREDGDIESPSHNNNSYYQRSFSSSDNDSKVNDIEKNMIISYMRDRNVEIIILVEGQDALTGGIVQARHSYTIDEICWDAEFVQCVYEAPDGSPLIDYNKFHNMTHNFHMKSY